MKKILAFSFAFFLFGCTNLQNDNEKSAENSTPKKEYVQITEFFDFGCGYCKRAAEMIPKLETKFGNKIKVEQRHYPLSPKTFKVAEAAECAKKQGKFRQFHDMAFANFGKYGEEDILNIVRNLNLNEEEFKICWDSGSMKSEVRKDQKMGEALGITGTPFFLVDGNIKIPGMPGEKMMSDVINKILEINNGENSEAPQ